MELANISVKRETLSDHAYHSIREAIVGLKFEPGQQVFEAELGSALGVSRTPIREAFRRLVAEELIEVQPQRGALITYISKKKIEEARFVRVCLETNAFKELAKQWNPNEGRFQKLHNELRDILADQQKMVEEVDFAGFFQLDEKFHNTILETVNNSTLISIINQMRGHLNRMRFLELLEIQHMKRLVIEHEAIFDAIVSNRAEETERLLSEHIRWSESGMNDLVQKYSHYFRP